MDINKIQDLVGRSVATYQTGYLVNNTDSKAPNEIYNISFKKGNYLLDLNQLQFCGRAVFQAQNASGETAVNNRAALMHLCADIPSDLFTAQSLRINNKELLQTLQLQIGRNRLHNWLKYELRDADMEDIDMSRNNLNMRVGSAAAFQTIGVNVVLSNATSCFVEGENLTQPMTNAAGAGLDPSMVVYQKKNKFASEYVQRHYSYAADNATGVIVATSLGQYVPSSDVSKKTNEYYSFFQIPIKDLFIELQTMGSMLDMSDKNLDIQIKLNAPANCLVSHLNGLIRADDPAGALTYSKFSGSETFRVTDTTIYSRILEYKSGMETIAKDFFSQPINYLSVVQDRSAVSSNTLNLRTNINAKQILCAVIFHTVQGRTGNAAPTLPISYITDITDSPLVSYYHESYAMPYQSCYVELQGQRYKQSDLNIQNKNVDFFVDSMNSLKEVFANKKLACSFNEFMLNKHFTIIPINPQGYSSQILGGDSNLANLHIEYNFSGTQFTRSIASLYDCHVFYIVSQTLLGDRVEA